MNDHDASHDPAIAEAEVLIRCVRGMPLDAETDLNWNTLLQLAQRHAVLPIVHQALLANEISVPETISIAAREASFHSQQLADVLESVLALVTSHGIEAMPLKGPVLAQELYGDTALRTYEDLDLLVRLGDFPFVEKLLIDASWQPYSSRDEYQRGFINDNTLMELHFGLASPREFALDVTSIWNRATNGTFRNQRIRVMSDTDRALYLLIHGLRHAYGKLSWIVDAARALNAIESCSARTFLQRAREEGLEHVVHIGCAMVQEVLPQQVSEEWRGALAESPNLVESANKALKKLLAASTDSQDPEIWRLYIQVETTRRQRWRRRLGFFTPTVEDYRWLDHHKLPRAAAPIIRPFRLLARHGIKRAWRTAFPGSD